ncbi:MAG: hypothetical protein KKF50_04525 [Nanoarchaeota archaeon]|nr:hypothetical protein [Nanoarchaeota archaeon]
MDVLEKIMGLQREGMDDGEISTRLQNEGVPLRDINDSLNQARVKAAVSSPAPGMGKHLTQAPPIQPPAQAPQMQARRGLSNQAGMQQSMMSTGLEEEAPQGPPQAQQMQPPMAPGPEIYPPQDGQQAYPPQDGGQDYYYPETPQAYSDQDYYAPQGGIDTETISEIAEQVVIEKLNEFKEKTGDLVSFKNAIQEKVDDIDDRLKRIENSIDKLQQAIIGKIGEFGESNAMIHKDLNNLHGTVSKLMNPLVDNFNELRKLAK